MNNGDPLPTFIKYQPNSFHIKPEIGKDAGRYNIEVTIFELDGALNNTYEFTITVTPEEIDNHDN